MNTVHSTTPRLSERRRAREERVLDAASAIVASDGIEALSLHRLARELDYVPAALYRYFASKDALIAALQRRAVTALHADFRRSASRAATPPPGFSIPRPETCGEGTRATTSSLARDERLR